MNDDGIVESVGQPFRSLLVQFNKFDTIFLVNLRGEFRANIATTDNKDATVGLFCAPQFSHDVIDMLSRSDKEHFIVCFNNRAALRD